jgi:hypothetical protein
VKFIVAIAFFFLTSAAFAQRDSALLLLRTYRGDITNVALDNLDNFYVVSSTGQIKKFNNRGDSVAVFNGIRNYGKLQTIDVTNPLKPLLFYKDFSTVVILDRLLSNRSSIDLRRHNILQPTAITLSYDNNIWVFDQFDNKLKKLDEGGNLLLQTTDFRQLFNQTISPQRLINDNGFLYLVDSTQGILVFDNYGAFKRKIQLKGWNNIDVWNGKLVRLGTNEVIVYNPATFTEQSQKFPSSFAPYIHSFTTHNKLVTFSTDSLRIYRLGY